jgi:hypothetical protein
MKFALGEQTEGEQFGYTGLLAYLFDGRGFAGNL